MARRRGWGHLAGGKSCNGMAVTDGSETREDEISESGRFPFMTTSTALPQRVFSACRATIAKSRMQARGVALASCYQIAGSCFESSATHADPINPCSSRPNPAAANPSPGSCEFSRPPHDGMSPDVFNCPICGWHIVEAGGEAPWIWQGQFRGGEWPLQARSCRADPRLTRAHIQPPQCTPIQGKASS
jgi:hypothetical protein